MVGEGGRIVNGTEREPSQRVLLQGPPPVGSLPVLVPENALAVALASHIGVHTLLRPVLDCWYY